MAFEEYDDYEQEQLVKEWLNKNWFTIAAGIVLGIAGLWGYGQWQTSKVEKSYEAANEFSAIAEAIELGDANTINELLGEYETEFGTNFFLVDARMKAAAKAVEAKDMAEARKQYQALVDAKPEKAMAELARLRLARLMVAEGDLAAAKTELGLVQSQAYQTMVEELLGDIYLAEGNTQKANDAYQLALNEGEGYSGRQIIEMKMSDLKSVN